MLCDGWLFFLCFVFSVGCCKQLTVLNWSGKALTDVDPISLVLQLLVAYIQTNILSVVWLVIRVMEDCSCCAHVVVYSYPWYNFVLYFVLLHSGIRYCIWNQEKDKIVPRVTSNYSIYMYWFIMKHSLTDQSVSDVFCSVAKRDPIWLVMFKLFCALTGFSGLIDRPHSKPPAGTTCRFYPRGKRTTGRTQSWRLIRLFLWIASADCRKSTRKRMKSWNSWRVMWQLL